jgi:lipopolysaccharide export system permease protein
VLIFRYFNRELLQSLVTVTIMILIIFLGNQLVRYLNDAAAGQMALAVLGKLMLLEIPYLLSLLLPLTCFLALLLTLGRFSADNELLVLAACGLSLKQQFRLITKVLLYTTALVAVLTLWGQPRIAMLRDELLSTTNAGASIDTIIPGKFQTDSSENHVFYINKSSVDHKHMQGIFMAEKRSIPGTKQYDDNQWNIVIADKGELITHGSSQYLSIQQGHRYSGTTGKANVEQGSFGSYQILLGGVPITQATIQMDATPTIALIALAKHDRLARAELEWRLSLPIANLLLGLLALPLGQLPPRQSRYGRLITGILIFIIYANSLFLIRAWVGEDSLSALPGIGWSHLVLLSIVVAMYTYKYPELRFWRRLFRGTKS